MGAFRDWECVPLSRFVPVGKALSFRLFVPEPPSLFFARERVYRNPHLKGKDRGDSFVGFSRQVLNRNCRERGQCFSHETGPKLTKRFDQ